MEDPESRGPCASPPLCLCHYRFCIRPRQFPARGSPGESGGSHCGADARGLGMAVAGRAYPSVCPANNGVQYSADPDPIHHPGCPPGEFLLRPAVFRNHHDLDQSADAVHGDDRNCRADFHHRPCLPRPAGKTPVDLPGLPLSCAVRGTAHCTAHYCSPSPPGRLTPSQRR